MSSFDRKADPRSVTNRAPVLQLLEAPSYSPIPVYYALKVQIDVLVCASGNAFQALYKNTTLCRKCTIQNITTTAGTIVTITAEAGTGFGISGVADSGVQLNAGSAQNVGGGSTTFGDTANPYALIDASKIFWTADNTSDAISVTLEIAGSRLY